jgi:arginase family enzyme
VIDPLQRWATTGEKPDYAGLLTFAGVPYTQDAAHLAGVDVAIVGAPTDDLVSDRPGTRFGPRAIRAASSPSGPELETSVDAIAELRVVDFGDAPVLPADLGRSHAAIEATVAEVLAAGMTTAELLWAVREVATQLDVIGADMVEVIPTGVGSADISALAADRIIREILGGIALRRRKYSKGKANDKEER